MMRTCSRCGDPKDLETAFEKHPTALDGYRRVCRDCRNLRRREHHPIGSPFKIRKNQKARDLRVMDTAWRLTDNARRRAKHELNPETARVRDRLRWPQRQPSELPKKRERGRYYAWQCRMTVFMHYGMKCFCCGEENIYFLQIDHMNGGGTKHRQILGLHGYRFYEWLIKNGFPSGYRTLCANCNGALGSFHFCPHRREHQRLMTPKMIENQNLRLLIFEHYGQCQCACCGEGTLEFLQLDHITPCGRRGSNKSGVPFYWSLKKQGFPAGYRVLCANCNSAVGFFGFCPHQEKRYGEMSSAL